MKNIRYWLLFYPFHFLIYELQPVIYMNEREEFMKRFYKNDIID